MKYIILWAFLNIHTGAVDGPYPEKDGKYYTAQECAQKLLDKGIQKPNRQDNIKVYECVAPPQRSTMQFTDTL